MKIKFTHFLNMQSLNSSHEHVLQLHIHRLYFIDLNPRANFDSHVTDFRITPTPKCFCNVLLRCL